MYTTYHPFKSVSTKEQFLKFYDAKAKKWPVHSKTEMIETSYGQTFVRTSGPDKATPLILLHGIGGNSFQWIPNIEALSEKYKTYAIDNIYDNGRSINTRPIDDADDFVNWFDELLTALELDNIFNIVGLSYGGWIATQYALRYPDRINKMVLLAPVGTIQPISFGWIGRAVLCAIPLRFFTRNFIYWLLDDLAKTGETGQTIIETHIDESYLALRSFKSRRLVNPTVLTDEQLNNIGIPVLYLVGENEKICHAKKALMRIQKVAPHIKAEMLPDVGHDLTISAAEMVNQTILGFLH